MKKSIVAIAKDPSIDAMVEQVLSELGGVEKFNKEELYSNSKTECWSLGPSGNQH